MITAKETRTKSEVKTNTKPFEEEMKKAEEKINMAIAEGRTHCSLGTEISKLTKKNLETLSYVDEIF